MKQYPGKKELHTVITENQTEKKSPNDTPNIQQSKMDKRWEFTRREYKKANFHVPMYHPIKYSNLSVLRQKHVLNRLSQVSKLSYIGALVNWFTNITVVRLQTRVNIGLKRKYGKS